LDKKLIASLGSTAAGTCEKALFVAVGLES
jgi:hypothetical protein